MSLPAPPIREVVGRLQITPRKLPHPAPIRFAKQQNGCFSLLVGRCQGFCYTFYSVYIGQSPTAKNNLVSRGNVVSLRELSLQHPVKLHLSDTQTVLRTHCEVRAICLSSHSAMLPFLHWMAQPAARTGPLPLTRLHGVPLAEETWQFPARSYLLVSETWAHFNKILGKAERFRRIDLGVR